MSNELSANIEGEHCISVLKLSHEQAKSFFLKGKSYCSFDLPPYIIFEGLLAKVDKYLTGKELSDMQRCNPRDADNINHIVLNNKDGKFAWRPLQLTHPALYVFLVHRLTESKNWDLIVKRFGLFERNPKIRCLSLPVESKTAQQDKAEQISQWWKEVEQRSIELSLEYEYIAESDITDCYASIYTHTVSWALHGRSTAKRERDKKSNLGNIIDNLLQDMNNGQTNGIPQGSVLMDFIAEIILGYADFILSIKIRKKGIKDYQILRYRDDYRIFVNHPIEGEEILKLISETMYCLGMKLNSTKTKISAQVVQHSIKPDKIEWIARKQSEKDLQKHLLIIHDFAYRYPNSGMTVRALGDFHKRVIQHKDGIRNVIPLIAIIVDIGMHNPKMYSLVAGILSKFVSSIRDEDERKIVLVKIKKRFEQVPNTGHLQIWLQRITYQHNRAITYSEPLCQLVDGNNPEIWNNNWIDSKTLRAMLNPKKIVDRKILLNLEPIISVKEVELFKEHSL